MSWDGALVGLFVALSGALALAGLLGVPWAVVKLPWMLPRLRGQDRWSQLVALVGCALLAGATVAWLVCVRIIWLRVTAVPNFGMSEIVMTGDVAGLIFLCARGFLSPIWSDRYVVGGR